MDSPAACLAFPACQKSPPPTLQRVPAVGFRLALQLGSVASRTGAGPVFYRHSLSWSPVTRRGPSTAQPPSSLPGPQPPRSRAPPCPTPRQLRDLSPRLVRLLFAHCGLWCGGVHWPSAVGACCGLGNKERSAGMAAECFPVSGSTIGCSRSPLFLGTGQAGWGGFRGSLTGRPPPASARPDPTTRGSMRSSAEWWRGFERVFPRHARQSRLGQMRRQESLGGPAKGRKV